MPDADQQAKSLPTLAGELWELVLAYFKQETVGPLRNLGRFVLFGVAGSFVLGIGLVVLLVAGVRALETETGSTFAGDWTWAPYGIALGGAVVIVALAMIGRSRGGRSR